MEISYKLKQKLRRHMLKELYRLGNVKKQDQIFLPHSTSPDYPKAYYVLNNLYTKLDNKKHERHMLKELYKLGKVKEKDRLFLPKRENSDYHKIYSVLKRQAISAQVLLYRKTRQLAKKPRL